MRAVEIAARPDESRVEVVVRAAVELHLLHRLRAVEGHLSERETLSMQMRLFDKLTPDRPAHWVAAVPEDMIEFVTTWMLETGRHEVEPEAEVRAVMSGVRGGREKGLTHHRPSSR